MELLILWIVCYVLLEVSGLGGIFQRACGDEKEKTKLKSQWAKEREELRKQWKEEKANNV